MKSCLSILFACALATSAQAGPKEDAFEAVKMFKKGYDSVDTKIILKAFSPDAIFLGTRMPKSGRGAPAINKYFANAAQSAPKSVEIENYEALKASDTVYVFSGQDTFHLTRKGGKKVALPARFTFVVSKGSDGWKIVHFHSSSRPKPRK